MLAELLFAGNKDNHNISDKFEIPPDRTKLPLSVWKIPIDLLWRKFCQHSSAFIFYQIFFFLDGN